MTTYVLEMTEEEARDARLPVIGCVEHQPRLRITVDRPNTIDLPVDDLADAWRSPLA